MLRVDVLTLFPELIAPFFRTSIMGKATEKGLVQFQAINFREYATNKHGTVDDSPYGGGGGMVLKPEPIFSAVERCIGETLVERRRIILMCPQGERFTQRKAEQLSGEEHLVFICGHYEGFDERIREHLVTDEISIGDYVLTGGEIPAMTVIDSVVRLLPGALGNAMSNMTDSFRTGWLEHPHYTRPPVFRGWSVPDILLSGHHENIETWRRKLSFYRTLERRPDLIDKERLDAEALKWLEEWQNSSSPE